MINIIGTILNTSGYDIHTRSLARAIGKITDARLTIQGCPGWESMVDDKELEMIKKAPEDDEINLIITNPMSWRMNTQAKRNFVFLIWEGDRVPKCFLKECLNPEIEYIFVPSEHTKKALMNTCPPTEKPAHIPNGARYVSYGKILESKIKIMEHGVDTKLFYPKEKPKKCTFFANKGFRNLQDRGGVQYLLRAYFEEFTDKDDVELVVKINPAYGTQNLQALIDQIAPRKEGLPLLKINIDNLPYNKMVELYNQCNVFVAPTRAEAYNLPCIEACACGLPVITTNFGGQTDYCNDETGWIIGGELEEVKHEVQYESCKWLKPDIGELRKVLRYAYEHPEEVKSKGKRALVIAHQNSWDKTAKKIYDLI